MNDNEEKKACCCGKIDLTDDVRAAQTEKLQLKVLGSGCANCQILAKNAAAALEQLGVEPVVGKVADFGEIASYGVMSTPALVIGRKVVSVGKVLSTEEIIKIIDKQRGRVQ